MDYKDKILCSILDCGYMDLPYLDDIRYDVGDIIKEYVSEVGTLPSFNAILIEVFEIAIGELADYIYEKQQAFENEAVILDPEQDKVLYDSYTKAMADLGKLNPEEDIRYYCNCLDTSWCFVKNENIYAKYLAEEVETLSERTGFPLSCQKECEDEETRDLEVKMTFTVDADSVEVFKRLERHVDELLNLDEWPEIKYVSGVTVK